MQKKSDIRNFLGLKKMNASLNLLSTFFCALVGVEKSIIY